MHLRGVGGFRLSEVKENNMINNDLLQTVLGHLALLEQKYPKKAASPVAKRLKRCLVRNAKDERRTR